jgi:7-cyano-7-deazaguanine synthase
MLDLALLGQVSDTALTQDREIQFGASGLPTTFVPGRNLLFFTFAAAVAYRRGLSGLVGGMCETDFSGYPDCRDDTVKAMQVALNLGMNQRFVLETPLMWIDKAQTWRLAEELGGEALVNLIRQDTHTCYLGERGEPHVWGHGCGHCPACQLRAEGFARYAAAPSA